MAEIVIDDGNAQMHHDSPFGHAKGLIPRDFMRCPVGYLPCAKPFSIPLIPESEWQDRLNEQVQAKRRLSDIRNTGMYGQRIPSRDQNGRGYCWAHSGVSAHLLARAAMGEPYADLSAYAVACIIKGYADEGGWGSEGVEWQAANGCPTSEFWPQQSTLRSNDNPNMRANAALHKYTEWMDLDPRDMKRQLTTCFLLNIPCVCDYNRWRHSVCGSDLVSITPYAHRIWNSWGDSWSDNGMGVLNGDGWLPDAAVACLLTTASAT